MFFHVWENIRQSKATEVCEFRVKIPAFLDRTVIFVKIVHFYLYIQKKS